MDWLLLLLELSYLLIGGYIFLTRTIPQALFQKLFGTNYYYDTTKLTRFELYTFATMFLIPALLRAYAYFLTINPPVWQTHNILLLLSIGKIIVLIFGILISLIIARSVRTPH